MISFMRMPETHACMHAYGLGGTHRALDGEIKGTDAEELPTFAAGRCRPPVEERAETRARVLVCSTLCMIP